MLMMMLWARTVQYFLMTETIGNSTDVLASAVIARLPVSQGARTQRKEQSPTASRDIRTALAVTGRVGLSWGSPCWAV